MKNIIRVIKTIFIIFWLIAAFFGFFDLFMVFILNHRESKYINVLPTNIAWVVFTLLAGTAIIIHKIKISYKNRKV
jgi:hypothetical protein